MSIDALSIAGPAGFDIQGGTVINNGQMYLGGAIFLTNSRIPVNATVSAGVFTGTGTLYVKNNVFLNHPMTQGALIVGWGEGEYKENGTCYINSALNLSGNALITQNCALKGTGSLVGSLTISGLLAPGANSPLRGTLSTNGSASFSSSGVWQVDIINGQANKWDLTGGGITVSPGGSIKVNYLDTFTADSRFLIATLPTAVTGNFTITSNLPAVNFTLVYEPVVTEQLGLGGVNVYLQTSGVNPSTLPITPNEQIVLSTLEALNQNTNACLQSKIDQIFALNSTKQLAKTLSQLQSSEFKAQQVSIEELIFVMNDDLKNYQYVKHDGYRGFVSAGLNYQKQWGYSEYPGFLSRGVYEFAGLTYGKNRYQALLALASTQSWIRFNQEHSKGSNLSGNLFVGLAGFLDRFKFGLDLMGGCHHLTQTRHIDQFSLVAKNSQNLWNFKSMLHGEYFKSFKHFDFNVYDDLSYYYGKQLGSTEHGATCLDLKVQASTRHVIRNAFGFKTVYGQKRSLKPYVDVAYVYENRFGGKTYTESFVNTTPKMRVKGYPFTHNLGKLNCGFEGKKNDFNYQLNFAGLYGRHYIEQGFSFTLERKY